jgi:hypothetical protein
MIRKPGEANDGAKPDRAGQALRQRDILILVEISANLKKKG